MDCCKAKCLEDVSADKLKARVALEYDADRDGKLALMQSELMNNLGANSKLKQR